MSKQPYPNLDTDGFTILRQVYSAGQVEALRAELAAALRTDDDATMHSAAGSVYGARNLLARWPAAAVVWRVPPLLDALAAALGSGFGLVRVLYFDKPPDHSWALPWHKDLTVAVRDNTLPSPRFGKPTRKAGVPHVEAPLEVLEAMLTARIHLDDVTDENGPLRVLPGSHRTGKNLDLTGAVPRSILVGRGDVLLMRPLLAHSSGHSLPGTARHRRVVHLEFAATPGLPDGYAWHDFVGA